MNDVKPLRVVLLCAVAALVSLGGAVISKTPQPLRQEASAANPAIPMSQQVAQPQSELRAAVRKKLAENFGRLPLSFEPNRGQTDKRVKFLSRGPGYTMFLTADGAVLKLQGLRGETASSRATSSPASSLRVSSPLASLSLATRDADDDGGKNDDNHAPVVLRMKLVGSNPAAQITPFNPLPGKSNYFIGNDPAQWRTSVPNYAKVRYHEAYPGVDLVYYGNPQQLEYDFVVAPGASSDAITLDLGMDPAADASSSANPASAAALHIDSNGDLVINTSGADLRFKKPVAYQTEFQPEMNERGAADRAERNPIEGRWILKGKNRVGFQIASYDSRKPLIIDPALSYATYLGGSAGDVAQAVTVDSSGSMYVTGEATSTNFPTLNAVQQTYAGHGDAFVTKLNPTGTALVYSTYLGGSGLDGGYGIAVDSNGNAYVGGDTGSKNFPVTKGAFQTTCGGDCAKGTSDVFVSVLDPTGSSLVYSTYLGGSGTDRLVEGITVDSQGDAYVTGWTQSTNFPVTKGAFQTTLPGTTSGFVTEINPTGSALLYSTYLGGTGSSVVTAIALDSSGDAYVTGWTSSTSFPTTSGVFQTSLAGDQDAFVAELNPTGSGLLYSTYIGGTKPEIAYSIAVNTAGNAYISGYTCSSDFPITSGAYKTTYTSSSCTEWGGNGFVTELAAGGSGLVYSTYFGGNGTEVAFGLALDHSGVVYITGRTNSTNFPTTPGAFQPKYAGGIDAFFSELDATGTGLVYSTYLGGSQSDAGYVIALDPNDNAYVGGRTYSSNFPVTPGSFQTTLPGTFAAMLFKFSPGDQVWPLALNFGTLGVGDSSSPLTTKFTNSEASAISISSIVFSGTDSVDFSQTNNCGTSLAPGATCSINVTFTPGANGTRTATLNLTDSSANSPQTVALSGVGSPVNLSPAGLTFTMQLIGTSSPSQPATLTNGGTTAINIQSIAASSQFSQTNNCTSPLGAGDSCAINVVFQPTASGILKGTLTVTDDAGTQTTNLTGTGTVISYSPTSLSFGTQTIKTSSAPRPITVTNVASSPVTIDKISLTGARATSYSETNNCPITPSTLAAGGTCTINVVFTPLLKGTLNADVTVTDTGGGSPQNIPLTGTGD
jgi:hypothetical protein